MFRLRLLISAAYVPCGAGWRLAALGSTAAGSARSISAHLYYIGCRKKLFHIITATLRAASCLISRTKKYLRYSPAFQALEVINRHGFLPFKLILDEANCPMSSHLLLSHQGPGNALPQQFYLVRNVTMSILHYR